ncbi:PepSY-associated TM helix domain-containing protein [Pseudomonas sp. NPDC077186]|uniref:PepSY-associated TM helix domain-containing protein n=1 Tax=Pseudomonas sp. NPDC077186 TaxID=3364421 RepID=UPI0037CBD6F7
MNSTTIRRWSFVHTWTSLICTLFLLMLAVTGLPLIFHHELEHLLGEAPELRALPAGTPHLRLQQLVDAAERQRPGEVLQYLGYDKDEPHGVIAITAASAASEPNASHSFMLDARSGEALAMPAANGGVLMFILRLHVDLFAGLPGKLLLAAMGLLFVAAMVSGAVLYAPFMRRLRFAEVRRHKSTRTRWLDLHNLIGIVTLTWALAVGITGVISASADLLIEAWREEALGALMQPYRDAPPLQQRASADQLLEIAAAALPGMRPDFIAFPGTRFSTEHHYTVFMVGNTQLTAYLWAPLLIDAQSLAVSAIAERPWYMDALSMSQPLHFGDYGGRPMQILWALLDVLTIVVLLSGLYLWWARRRTARAAVRGEARA